MTREHDLERTCPDKEADFIIRRLRETRLGLRGTRKIGSATEEITGYPSLQESSFAVIICLYKRSS